MAVYTNVRRPERGQQPGSPAGPRKPSSELAGCPPRQAAVSAFPPSSEVPTAAVLITAQLGEGSGVPAFPWVPGLEGRTGTPDPSAEVLQSPGLGVHAPLSRAVMSVRLIFSMPQLPPKEQKGLREEHGWGLDRGKHRHVTWSEATGRWHLRAKAARAKGTPEPALGRVSRREQCPHVCFSPAGVGYMTLANRGQRPHGLSYLISINT